MRHHRNWGIALLAGALLLAGSAGNALALTNACTPIENQATLDYVFGGVNQPDILSDPDGTGTDKTIFDVASLINLTNTVIVGPTLIVPSATDKVLTFEIQNTGNEDARYMLQLYDRNGATVGGHVDGLDMESVRVYTDTDNTYGSGGTQVEIDGAWDATTESGTDLGLAPDPVTEGVFVAPNGKVWVHVVANVPAAAANGLKDLFTLRAIAYHDNNDETGTAHGTAGGWIESANGSNTNACASAVVRGDNVDSDGAAGAGGTLDTATPDGAAVATSYYVVETASITVKKEYTVEWDPISASAPYKPIPGARILYTITITNNSTTTNATSLVLIDPIPSNTNYYVTTPATADAAATITYSTDGSDYTHVPADNHVDAVVDGADPDVSHVKFAIATLAYDDSAGANVNDNDVIVTFRVLIE